MQRNVYRPQATRGEDEQYLADVKKFASTANKAQLIVKRDELLEKIEEGGLYSPDAVRLARLAIEVLEKEMVVMYEVGVVARRNRVRG
jgi:hypothetical protein